MEILGYIASAIMGLTLGLIGGGGSILTVPILVYLFGTPAVTATGYSLFIVGLASLVGAGTSMRKGQVDFATGFAFALPSFVGVYLARAYAVPNLPDEFSLLGVAITKEFLLLGVFAIMMLLASITMIRSGKKKVAPQPSSLSATQRYTIIGIEGLVVGSITGFVGAGGGFLIIPALVILAGLPMQIAVGTSLMIIAIKSLFGFLGDVQSAATAIDWAFLLQISAIAVVGIFVGSHFASRVPDKALKRGFGWFVLTMGSIMLIQQVIQLKG